MQLPATCWPTHESWVNAVAVGRAGDRDVIISGSDDGTVEVWDAVTRDPVGAPLAGHDDSVNAVAIGRAWDRDIIVSGSDDRTVLMRQHCSAPTDKCLNADR